MCKVFIYLSATRHLSDKSHHYVNSVDLIIPYHKKGHLELTK